MITFGDLAAHSEFCIDDVLFKQMYHPHLLMIATQGGQGIEALPDCQADVEPRINVVFGRGNTSVT